ncbi:MAG: hypothetical protein V3S41_08045 [Spirochaetia bacterium]
MKILIYGIGNPGRQDDGLGALLVEEIQRAVGSTTPTGADHEFSFDANYQLNIEDAEAISRHDIVVFADASSGGGFDSGTPDAGAAGDAAAASDAAARDAVATRDTADDDGRAARDATDNAGAAGDAAEDGVAFRLYPIGPEPTASFSTHSVSPGGIVALCHELYDAHPKTYMLAIRGYEWGVNEPLSERAQTNLDAAARFLMEALRQPGSLSLPGGRT